MNKQTNFSYLVEYKCAHCDLYHEERISLSVPFIANEVKCLGCGGELRARRRVSRKEKEVKVWVEYR